MNRLFNDRLKKTTVSFCVCALVFSSIMPGNIYAADNTESTIGDTYVYAGESFDGDIAVYDDSYEDSEAVDTYLTDSDASLANSDTSTDNCDSNLIDEDIATTSGNGVNGIIYYLAGGTQNPDNPSTYDNTHKTKLYKPTRAGYKFGGWYSKPTLKNSSKVKFIKKGKNGDVILYAKWTPIKYKITYKMGKNAKNNKANPKKYTIETPSINLAAPTKKKCEFLGWYLDKDYTIPVETIDTTQLKKITIYAKWNSLATKKVKIDYGKISSVRDGELALINKYRNSYGVDSISQNELLNAAAQVRAKEIATKFSHTRPNGTSCFTAMDEAGYVYYTAGENIAKGHTSVDEVMKAWMNSPGHRANILCSAYKEVGIGYYKVNGVKCWVQMFGASYTQ